MSTLDATRAELALVILYLNKPKAREKICKAIQYGLKFWSDGQPGTAQNVDKSTSLARKVFHLFKVGWYRTLWCKTLIYIHVCVYTYIYIYIYIYINILPLSPVYVGFSIVYMSKGGTLTAFKKKFWCGTCIKSLLF